METQTTSSKAKDFFINLGAIVALYTLVVSLIDLLFTVINTAYPQIVNGYNYYAGSSSISWPVATLIIFFPIFIVLMWLLEQEYKAEPAKQGMGIHKWLTYTTLFISGLAIAGDLITVLYYFIDGQELTTGFILKIAVLLVIAGAIFIYYISDVRGKLTAKSRMIWRIVSGALIIASVVWGFSVLGSPRTQRLYKYDEQKVSDLTNINQYVISYYQSHGELPTTLDQLSNTDSYFSIPNDSQSNTPYEYNLIDHNSKTYNLCSEFNKSTNTPENVNVARVSPNYDWTHPAGHYCFKRFIDSSTQTFPKPISNQ